MCAQQIKSTNNTNTNNKQTTNKQQATQQTTNKQQATQQTTNKQTTKANNKQTTQTNTQTQTTNKQQTNKQTKSTKTTMSSSSNPPGGDILSKYHDILQPTSSSSAEPTFVPEFDAKTLGRPKPAASSQLNLGEWRDPETRESWHQSLQKRLKNPEYEPWREELKNRMRRASREEKQQRKQSQEQQFAFRRKMAIAEEKYMTLDYAREHAMAQLRPWFEQFRTQQLQFKQQQQQQQQQQQTQAQAPSASTSIPMPTPTPTSASQSMSNNAAESTTISEQMKFQILEDIETLNEKYTKAREQRLNNFSELVRAQPGQEPEVAFQFQSAVPAAEAELNQLSRDSSSTSPKPSDTLFNGSVDEEAYQKWLSQQSPASMSKEEFFEFCKEIYPSKLDVSAIDPALLLIQLREKNLERQEIMTEYAILGHQLPLVTHPEKQQYLDQLEEKLLLREAQLQQEWDTLQRQTIQKCHELFMYGQVLCQLEDQIEQEIVDTQQALEAGTSGNDGQQLQAKLAQAKEDLKILVCNISFTQNTIKALHQAVDKAYLKERMDELGTDEFGKIVETLSTSFGILFVQGLDIL